MPPRPSNSRLAPTRLPVTLTSQPVCHLPRSLSKPRTLSLFSINPHRCTQAAGRREGVGVQRRRGAAANQTRTIQINIGGFRSWLHAKCLAFSEKSAKTAKKITFSLFSQKNLEKVIFWLSCLFFRGDGLHLATDAHGLFKNLKKKLRKQALMRARPRIWISFLFRVDFFFETSPSLSLESTSENST